MNFLAMPTLKNARACLRLPISMMPRFSLKLTLARLRTGMERVGSLLRSAAPITTSATPTSFFSTAPVALGFARAMLPLCLPARGWPGLVPGCRLRAPGRRLRLSLARPALSGGASRRARRCRRALPPPPVRRSGLWFRVAGLRDRARLGVRQRGRLAFGSLGSDDDRMREAFRAAGLAQDLVGP